MTAHIVHFESTAEETHLLPQISQPKPQNIAPTKRPMFCAKERNGPLKWNSFIAGLRMSPPRSGQQLSLFTPNEFSTLPGRNASGTSWWQKGTYANHPKPATANSHH